jgi:hypothetical protein
MNPTQVAETQLASYVNHVFYRQPGQIIAQGTNTTPVPHNEVNLVLRTYEIVEVTLPSPVSWEVWAPDEATQRLQLQTRTFDKVWRVVVIGGPFLGGNERWSIWIDNTAVGYGLEWEDTLTTVIFDRTLLREGARIGVGYGGSPTYLPETLHISTP